MFYEIEIYKEYIDSLINLLETVHNKENVYLDLCFNVSEKIEKIDTNKITSEKLVQEFKKGVNKLKKLDFPHLKTKIISPEDDFYFHADYRRDLNYNYCKKVDYVMHGETDSFLLNINIANLSLELNFFDKNSVWAKDGDNKY